MKQHIEATGRSEAPPSVVHRLLCDGATWPTWTSIDAFELERPGADGREGVGAIRVWTTGRRRLREEVVEVVADRRFSYTVLSGMAIRGYRADIDLEPDGTGTRITWRSSFTAKAPGFGGIYRRALQQATEGFVAGLAAEAAAASV